MCGRVAKRQILFDTIDVGWSEERCLFRHSVTFGTFTLKQMASASDVEQDLARCCYLEAFDFLVLMPLGRAYRFNFLEKLLPSPSVENVFGIAGSFRISLPPIGSNDCEIGSLWNSFRRPVGRTNPLAQCAVLVKAADQWSRAPLKSGLLQP